MIPVENQWLRFNPKVPASTKISTEEAEKQMERREKAIKTRMAKADQMVAKNEGAPIVLQVNTGKAKTRKVKKEAEDGEELDYEEEWADDEDQMPKPEQDVEDSDDDEEDMANRLLRDDDDENNKVLSIITLD
jgi:hypothetical protein